jgi:hypothetical protein
MGRHDVRVPQGVDKQRGALAKARTVRPVPPLGCHTTTPIPAAARALAGTVRNMVLCGTW